MRISDWSSDVCSSDLLATSEYIAGADYTIADMAIWPWYGALAKGLVYDAGEFLQVQDYKHVQRWTNQIAARPAVKRGRMVNRAVGDPANQLHERRSEEHTSELQSLMRISYAVFCLKKK